MSVISGGNEEQSKITFGLGCGFRRWELSGRKVILITPDIPSTETYRAGGECRDHLLHPLISHEMKLTEVSLQSQAQESHSRRHESRFWDVSSRFHLFVPLINLKISDHQ